MHNRSVDDSDESLKALDDFVNACRDDNSGEDEDKLEYSTVDASFASALIIRRQKTSWRMWMFKHRGGARQTEMMRC